MTRDEEMKRQRGLTLIELLVSLLIASAIMAGVYRVFIHQAKVYAIQESTADAQNSTRAGMEIMLADLRMAGYDKQGGGSNVAVSNSVSCSPNSIRVEWERDNNTLYSVQYFLSNQQLQRNVYLNGLLTGDSPQVVLDDVSRLNFDCPMSGTRYVSVNVTLAVKNRELSSSIIFRNVR